MYENSIQALVVFEGFHIQTLILQSKLEEEKYFICCKLTIEVSFSNVSHYKCLVHY